MKPASPVTTKRWKEKEEKKSNLEMEIRKNISHLYELAKTLHESEDQSYNANSDATVKSEKPVNTDSTVERANTDITVQSKSTDL